MEFDLRFLVTMGGIIASVGGSFAVVRSQVERLRKDVDVLGNKIANLDSRLDQNDVATSKCSQRLDTLADILSPTALADQTRRIERLRADVDHLMQTK